MTLRPVCVLEYMSVLLQQFVLLQWVLKSVLQCVLQCALQCELQCKLQCVLQCVMRCEMIARPACVTGYGSM